MIDHICMNKVLLHDLLERLENDGNISCEIINKRAGPNKRAGWNFLKKNNKRAGPNKSKQDGNSSNYK